MIRRLVLAAFAATALFSSISSACAEAPAGAEMIAWDKTPIALALPVGKERMVSFPGAVQPGLPRELASTLRVQTVADTLYIKAAEGFETARMPVREIETGRIYLLDLKGEESAPTTPVRIAVAGEAAPETSDALRTTAPAGVGPAPDYGLMTLTRFAASQVYAPERLIAPLAGVTRTPVTRTVAPQIFEGAYVEVTPLASWRARNGLYVTALKLKNRLNEHFEIDPRRIRGEWLATTLHHRALGPRGAASDTTTAYVVSDKRFEEAAAPWLD